MADEFEVQLYAYDLSNGMARQLSQALTGKQIDAIWHTSVVVHGMEVFFGQGISIVKPGTSHHGQPLKVHQMGTTALDRETFLEYIEGLRETYTASKYHLLDNNCNHFTADVIGFLTGGGIPSEIKDLPQDFLSTPLGAALRPTIDSMFRSANDGAIPAIPNGLPSGGLLDGVFQSAMAPQQSSIPASSGSLTSPITVCTNAASFNSLLMEQKCVVALFTNEAGCPPCRAIRPVFDDIAYSYHSVDPLKKRKKIAFAMIDTQQGFSLARQWGITATPTFFFFLDGKKDNELKGASPHNLKSAVDLLVFTAYPPHPHTKLSLPQLIKISHNNSPVLYKDAPKFSAALSKLNEFLSSAPKGEQSTTSVIKASFETMIIPFLTSPTQTASQILMTSWAAANKSSLNLLPPSHWFPIIDFLRFGLTIPAVSSWVVSTSSLAEENVLDFLIMRIAKESTSSDLPKPVFLTTLRLMSNTLGTPLLANHYLSNQQLRQRFTDLLLKALLSSDQTIVTCAAGVAFGAVARAWSERIDWLDSSQTFLVDEDWEIEIASAVIETIDREKTNADVVHRLGATLGLLLYLSPNHMSLEPLMETLEAKRILNEASQGKASDLTNLLKEVGKLCESNY